MDKIGDLVCTLPVDEVPWLKGAQVRWIIQMGMGFVAQNAVPGRRFLQLEKKNGFESFLALRRFLRQEKFDVVVSFQGPWWVSLAMWLEKVPVRAGRISQWHSFLFFNRGLRQRRSLGGKHEAVFNIELLAHALGKPLDEPAPVLRLQAPAFPDVQTRLGLQEQGYVIVHPGMAGSALNWPQKNYVSLIETLSHDRPVVITGTPADEPWLTEIRKGLAGTKNVRWLVGELTPPELLEVLSKSRLVIAPSTGVAHLAAALGRPLVAFFSPARSQHPIRWAPRGPQVSILLPTVPPKTVVDASCMEKITVDMALEKARPWV